MKPGLKTVLAGVLCLCCIACKQKKKKDPSEKFFPVLSFIKSQVAHVDTSFYTILKITKVDSSRNDTAYLQREAFRDAAKDFLSIPDISAAEYEDRYTEDKQFDETLGRVLLSYTPVKPGNEEIQSQQLLIKPDPAEGDKVKTIIINSSSNNKDSLVEKRMLWNVDKNFQVTTIRQYKNGPETVSTFSVVWNQDDN